MRTFTVELPFPLAAAATRAELKHPAAFSDGAARHAGGCYDKERGVFQSAARQNCRPRQQKCSPRQKQGNRTRSDGERPGVTPGGGKLRNFQ